MIWNKYRRFVLLMHLSFSFILAPTIGISNDQQSFEETSLGDDELVAIGGHSSDVVKISAEAFERSLTEDNALSPDKMSASVASATTDKKKHAKTPSKMTASMKTFFLDTHNKMRRDVALGLIHGQPPAADMNKLEWDDELASRAQAWANQCTAEHDSNAARSTFKFPFVGQNWGGMRHVSSAMRLWFREHAFYDYHNQDCSKKPCAHFTQLVWSWTTHVGCGIADCFNIEGFPYGRTVVCDYGPGGNVQAVKPYKEGPACSSCLAMRPYCDVGLCVK